MTSGRSFVTWDGNHISNRAFDIIEGLMHGTVNSPLIFNIYTHKVPTLFNSNHTGNTYATAFADDLIILAADKQPAIVQDKLEKIVNDICIHYLKWNLKINPNKCETILFRKPLNAIGNNKRTDIKNFHINISIDNKQIQVEHKRSVRYLGVILDDLLRLNAHILSQLDKARSAFKKYARLFFCRSLAPRCKVICYLLLIRPILTYAAPIWWNVSASLIEKIRKFERNCLRASLHIYIERKRK